MGAWLYRRSLFLRFVRGSWSVSWAGGPWRPGWCG